ncbi:unnamed protein product [Urochloa humidicola]
MEFACRGRPAADHDGGDSQRSPDPPPPHGHDAGDTMLVIRDALLLQLRKDRLRQEIIMAELSKLERAMNLCSAACYGIDTAYMEKPKPLSFTFSEEFMPHHSWREHYSDADEVHGLKKKDVKHGSVQVMSGKPDTEDRFSVCSRPCCSNSKAEEENESFDEQKLQESNEPKKISSSLKWELTGITIPVKKPKPRKSWSCAICQVETPNTEHNIQQHCTGKKHQSNVASLESRNKAISQKQETTAESPSCAGQETSCAGQETSSINWSCSTCQADGTSEADLKEHLSGRTHQQNIEAQCQEGDSLSKNAELTEVTLPVKRPKATARRWSCTVCQVEATSEHNLQEHFAGQKHQANVASSESRNNGGRHLTTIRALQQEESKSTAMNPVHLRPPSAALGKLPLVNGSSSSEMARHMMSLYFCKVCNVQCSSEVMFEDHRKGKKHRGKVWKQKVRTFCKVCNLQCNSDEMLADHLTGKKHQKNARLMGLI